MHHRIERGLAKAAGWFQRPSLAIRALREAEQLCRYPHHALPAAQQLELVRRKIEEARIALGDFTA